MLRIAKAKRPITKKRICGYCPYLTYRALLYLHPTHGEIIGFDLVGAEDRGNPTAFYLDELRWFSQTCDERKSEIPYLSHAGETLLDTARSSEPAQSNLFDAVLLKSKRIGHGFSLVKCYFGLACWLGGPVQLQREARTSSSFNTLLLSYTTLRQRPL
ncbi:uncharacterized protein BDZ99DRAFT_527376 [Mytilinidion resinicola]|uniref:Adenosine deaminase domain-containing protein n=1 Tax=Mytilinidion resinicola TaxID=574789 RepID=A0A6A6Y2B5_9PEZI|nr:uncharacterized protein BDZ99DRAFT_527376 [Mytilinidion resinicola]KAF2802653.1 hypothetical protein BDZ99DRAFT_527376 [Mytilinidion resinicola]